ncbi:hypothetical protein Lfu02_68860 [Longispora fulva]|uniref:Transcriptional regulator with XRE-family HTH domain n=1 Tax=Longispora fulva TaxID=619741 RepID=A0A8J7GB48_9ACTN|nr:helix-turn-helix transcriptional regulator [Longispora fulva]MBG6134141.1 transcriptional regulator with XRE-family HTH domain [Longispora fulva]GIG62514.1 hypothetical protein Lfu02_68860 [Longispora fulva]
MSVRLPGTPFHTALRQAIRSRRLSLQRLHDHLADKGVHVSVSTLSNWQRGNARPTRPNSRLVLRALEDVLGVSGLGTLALGPVRQRRSLSTSRRPGTIGRQEVEIARGSVGVLVAHESLRVGHGRYDWTLHVRLTVRARVAGADRLVVHHQADRGVIPAARAGEGCVIGRSRVEGSTGLVAVELLLPAPLAQGETCPVEYQITLPAGNHYPHHGRWLDEAGQIYDLSIRFADPAMAKETHRIWHIERNSPFRDVGQLRLIAGTLLHFVGVDLPPGYHGVRWG